MLAYVFVDLTEHRQTKILIIESVVTPATVSQESSIDSSRSSQFPSILDGDAAGAYKPTIPPSFVPTNFGVNSKMPLALGVHLMGAFNAYERTLVSPN